MTANMIKGKGFRGALRYNLEKVEKGVAEILGHSFVNATQKTIMKEIQMVKVLRPNLQKFFYHTSINFPPHEDLSNERMKAIAMDYLRASGFENHQFIRFRHRDADHPHLHILVNRIGYGGKVLSDSNDYARTEKILRDLEKKYYLTQVIPSREAKERAMTKDELEMIKRTNTPSRKMQLQDIIREAIKGRSKLTCSEFIQVVERNGVNILFNQASTGYVSGISYSYKGITITGAKLGNDFKWTTIKSKIDYEQERDRLSILITNARTKSIQDDAGRNQSNPPTKETTLPPYGTNGLVSVKRNQQAGGRANQSAKGPQTNNQKPERFQSNEFNVDKVLASILDSDHRNTVEPVNPSDLAFSRDGRRKKRRRGRRI